MLFTARVIIFSGTPLMGVRCRVPLHCSAVIAGGLIEKMQPSSVI